MHYLLTIRGTLGEFINPLLISINDQLIAGLPIPQFFTKQPDKADILITCANSLEAIVLGARTAKHYNQRHIVYAMDDWKDHHTRRWVCGSGFDAIRSALNECTGIIAVSPMLIETMHVRYGLAPKHSLVAHNPVDCALFESAPKAERKKRKISLAYAGSIWKMHFDALLHLAIAVSELRKEGLEIELILYTQREFWEMYRLDWEKYGVVWGTFLPYEKLPSMLQEVDALVVASSFETSMKHLTAGSLQTKITEYMASGKPIIAIGPEYAACNKFVKDWECGISLESNAHNVLANELKHYLSDSSQIYRHGNNGRAAAVEHFNITKVQRDVFEFIFEMSL